MFNMGEFPSELVKDIPERLLQIPQPPKQLYYRGSKPSILTPSVAIVGTRKPTSYGVGVTEKFAYELAKAGAAIISGMALGVDAIALRAALKAKGRVTAVLPCGIEAFYPKTNSALGENILKSGGTIISEYPGNDSFIHKSKMIERNRIVSGLSDVLLITEAAERSGTTSTANFALDQGRTVMVIPGNITSVMSRGTNNLIKEGAIPVTSITDVLEVLGLTHQTRLEQYQPVDKNEETVLSLIKDGVLDIDQIILRSKLKPAVINMIITKFEIAKII